MKPYREWLKSVRIEDDYGDGMPHAHKPAEPTRAFWLFLMLGCPLIAVVWFHVGPYVLVGVGRALQMVGGAR